MTVKELIEELKGFDQDALVVMSRDAEGNQYSPLESAGNYRYQAHTKWSGDIVSPDEEEEGQSACVFWPLN